MGVSSKAERRAKPSFQQVLLQLSPFYWQGDASWAWNTKVPIWTGKLFSDSLIMIEPRGGYFFGLNRGILWQA